MKHPAWINEDWRTRYAACYYWVACHRVDYISDDNLERMTEIYGESYTLRTVNLSITGAIMTGLGYGEKTGESRASLRKVAHGKKMVVWKSLIYKGPDE
jgi:hypothetical protein